MRYHVVRKDKVIMEVITSVEARVIQRHGEHIIATFPIGHFRDEDQVMQYLTGTHAGAEVKAV